MIEVVYLRRRIDVQLNCNKHEEIQSVLIQNNYNDLMSAIAMRLLANAIDDRNTYCIGMI